MLFGVKDHLGAGEQTLIVNYHLLKKFGLLFEFSQFLILLLTLLFQSLYTVVRFPFAVEQISLADNTLNFLLCALSQMKFQIE